MSHPKEDLTADSNHHQSPTPLSDREPNGDADAANTGELERFEEFDGEEDPTVETRNESGSGEPRGARRRRPRGKRRPSTTESAQGDYDPKDDERAQQALTFLSDVMDQMGMECSVHLCPPKEDAEILLEITGEDAGRVIGKKGHVLTALQFITNRVINRPGLEKRHILVDVEGYRHRRENQLANMALRLGDQAMDDGKIITFEPMNPRDRRVVHLALAKMDGVITRSDGEGDQRRVQIIPVRR